MTHPKSFDKFLSALLGIFTQRSFSGMDFLSYLNRSDDERSGDEASIVDTAIVSPLLGLLGFEPAERIYNQQHLGDRPDFAPRDAVYGTCFVVENKSTSISLTFDLNDPDSHLSQLRSYMRVRGVTLGWLTNGKQLTVWGFYNWARPQNLINIDLKNVIQDWHRRGVSTLSETTEQKLHDLFDLFQKEAFTSLKRLEAELALDEEEWQRQALPLGNGSGNEPVLVEALRSLVLELQRNARRLLTEQLARYAEYQDRANRITDNAVATAIQEIQWLREKVLTRLQQNQSLVDLSDRDFAAIEEICKRLEQDARAYISPKEVFAEILAILNEGFNRKHQNKAKPPKPPSTLSAGYQPLNDALKPYVEKVFAWHQRQANLRQDYQAEIRVHDDYMVWTALVEETMLGGLEESQRQDEFALQAAYVVFIRLLLLRVCEDKGVFPHRFVSDGGVKRWQENIERYWVFATGNPYSPLLDMAYKNAQNIYAHFFTGRDLFNWFVLEQRELVITLHQLSRFNFSGVDSDIVGTVYSTYVDRKEKKEKGQYYTPPEIVNYILDEVGYQTGSGIIGANKRLIDPACGSGSFLVAAAKRLVESYKGNTEEIEDPASVLDRVQNNLYGFDLNPFACYLAEVNLLIQVLDLVKLANDRGQPTRIERFNIFNVDALARPTGSYRSLMFNTLIARESDRADQIKSRSPNTPYANGFAFIVGNPPYGPSLSDEYKNVLKSDYADVFFGQPDTYVFFFQLGIELLGNQGKLGFITPNTYLMGKNTAALRKILLEAGRIEQIVDLPQGIWKDASVDCVLLFLTQESNEEQRQTQQPQINLLGVRDTFDKLTTRSWSKTVKQQQYRWLENSTNQIDIRYDALIQKIEDACLIQVKGNGAPQKVLRLGDVTESTQGIIVYKTKAEGQANVYIKDRTNVGYNETDWHPLLETTGFLGRYELRWGEKQPYLKYGHWLCRYRERKYFDSPKILLVRLRNKALKRRLVATFDDTGFYNRDNFNNIIQADTNYKLKYLLALFNSSVLNHWYRNRFDNVNINPKTFRQLPIYPADTETQAELVEKVDRILKKNQEINKFREQGYVIRKQRDGNIQIEIPYDRLLSEIQENNPNFSTLTLFDAKAVGLFTIPERCDLRVTISKNVSTPTRYPTSIVLRHNKLWLVADNDKIRRYLLSYLKLPQWQGKTWNEIKDQATLPGETQELDTFFATEEKRRTEIQTLLNEVVQIDAEIDDKVLDLYSITEPIDRERILRSAPISAEDETNITQDSEEE
ncbi:N-6 DNA methylase [Okeania sp.]|uniref:N-6 DNA methylase n=1 Tax=Okeania sp. TaxID=3100323 RepID=UPI002B4B1402|nr:N-6 DNA methylase [Okeania sp.]MEB3341472.1 N-6 DNA methylase [Okeania sp.]